jgi:hypothetical protein
VVAINYFNPPRLFIVETCKGCREINEDLIRHSLLVKEGDVVDFDMHIRHFDIQSPLDRP